MPPRRSSRLPRVHPGLLGQQGSCVFPHTSACNIIYIYLHLHNFTCYILHVLLCSIYHMLSIYTIYSMLFSINYVLHTLYNIAYSIYCSAYNHIYNTGYLVHTVFHILHTTVSSIHGILSITYYLLFAMSNLWTALISLLPPFSCRLPASRASTLPSCTSASRVKMTSW